MNQMLRRAQLYTTAEVEPWTVGKYEHNSQAGYSSKFGLWLNSWHSISFWHRMNVV